MRIGRRLRRLRRRRDPFSAASRRSGAGSATPEPPVGVVFDESDFSDAGGGIPAGFEPAGTRDFPRGGYALGASEAVFSARIDPSAPTNGDAGILRSYQAAEGQEFTATAVARIRDVSGGFKARLTIAPKMPNGRQLGEFNAKLETAADNFVEISIPSASMPPGTAIVSVKFRAHTKAPGDAGTADLQRFRFERIR